MSNRTYLQKFALRFGKFGIVSEIWWRIIAIFEILIKIAFLGFWALSALCAPAGLELELELELWS